MRSIPRLLLLLALALAGYAVDTMPKTFGEVRTRTGAAQSGARVLVTLVGTGTNATLYQDDESTVRVNPLTSDSNGLYQFKSAPGVYDITVSLNGTVIDQRSHFAVGNLTATVSSIALTMPAEYSVAGSPITTAGTLAVTKATQSANTIWAGPTTGAAAAPTFRAVVPADIATALTTPPAIGGTTPAAGAFTTLSAANNFTFAEAANIVGGTSTGTKIGTSTSQKFAFYNSTPIVKPTGDVATALSNLGLVASPTVIATTNANLTGPITSVGNATSVAAQTGTGTTFVMDTSPTLVTPTIGAASGTSLALGGALQSTFNGTTITPVFQILSASANANMGVARYSNDANAGSITLAKSKATSIGGSGIVTAAANLGHVQFQGDDGTGSLVDSARITAQATGTPSTGIVPGKLLLRTANAAGTLTTGITLDETQTVTLANALPIASGGTASTTAATARSSLGLAVYDFPMHLEAPTAKIYYLLPASNVAYTINNLYAATVSGTCTVAVKINGTNVTGLSAVAITSTPSTTNGTAANSVAAGDTVTVVVSSPSSCVDLFLNVKMTR